MGKTKKSGPELCGSLRMVLIGLFFLSGSVCLAQHRVFTNDDIASPAPAPQPAAPAAESPAAAPDANQPEAAPPAEPTGPQAEVKRLTAILMALGEASDEMDRRAQSATTEIERNHFNTLRDCLSNVLTDYRSFIDQAQRQVQASQSPQ